MKKLSTVITGVGSYIPEVKLENKAFESTLFYNPDGSLIDAPGSEIIDKFKDITGIIERRYVTENLQTSDIAAMAAKEAIANAGIDPETIDQIILAHNFGDVRIGTIQTDILPSIASRVKHLLGIKNPLCVPYDILFGCPGWVQGVIQADSYIKSGLAKRCLVIGAETLSRVVDPHDRDSMIYSDGAGATIVEGVETDEEEPSGILSAAVMSHTADEAYYLYLGMSNKPGSDEKIRYIKMHGRKIYEYAITQVPQAMKIALDKSGVPIEKVKKVLIHQANEKMDEAMIIRFFKLYKKREIPEHIMPMSIHKLGNSSVATIPTLFDLIIKKQLENHEITKGDILLFASVGAGMNINAFVYRY
ncbi:MAG TPA: 3-oxoacyl-ACP synthase [Bacteroidales bacterium]|nr:3-oxoacyl-ACP synthase [Bacteroidales bacterium]